MKSFSMDSHWNQFFYCPQNPLFIIINLKTSYYHNCHSLAHHNVNVLLSTWFYLIANMRIENNGPDCMSTVLFAPQTSWQPPIIAVAVLFSVRWSVFHCNIITFFKIIICYTSVIVFTSWFLNIYVVLLQSI